MVFKNNINRSIFLTHKIKTTFFKLHFIYFWKKKLYYFTSFFRNQILIIYNLYQDNIQNYFYF